MVTIPAPARRLSADDLPLLVFIAVVLLLMLATSESREWMWTKFADIVLDTFGWLGADIGPLTT